MLRLELIKCPGAEVVKLKKTWILEDFKDDNDNSYGLCGGSTKKGLLLVERCTAMDENGNCAPYSETERMILGINVQPCPLRIREKKSKISSSLV